MCEGRCKHSAKGSLSFHQEHSPRQSWDECAVGSKTLFFLVSPLCGSGAWTHDLVISEQKCHIVSCHLLTRPKNGGTQFSFQMVDNSPCSCHLLNVWGKKSLVPMSSDPYIYMICRYACAEWQIRTSGSASTVHMKSCILCGRKTAETWVLLTSLWPNLWSSLYRSVKSPSANTSVWVCALAPSPFSISVLSCWPKWEA